MTSVESQRVFLAMIREGAGYVCTKHGEGEWAQVWAPNNEEMIRIAERHHTVCDVYISPAKFPHKDRNRKAEYASSLRAFWLDIDRHEGSKWATDQEILSALDDFLRKTGLPAPNIKHFTGHGFHFYWALNKSVAREVWEPIAKRLQALLKDLGTGADPLTADVSRVLRLPETTNFRNRHEPIKTELEILSEQLIDLEAFDKAVDQALCHLVAAQEHCELTPSNSIEPTKQCNRKDFERALDAIPANIDRDTWIKVILSGKAHGFQGVEELLRAWSAKAGPYHEITNRLGYDADAFSNVWKCEPREISHRTLYFIAKQFKESRGQPTYGDTLNGKRFAELYKGAFVFCYPRGKWLRFDGHRWLWCSDSEPLQAAKATASYVLKQAMEAFKNDPQSGDAKKALTQAKDTFNLKRLQSMITCAASEPGMYISEISDLDRDPMLLGCKNGIIDLKNGELLASRPEHLMTKTVRATYDPDAPCPHWERFLSEVTLADSYTQWYLQKMAGYFLTGMVGEEVLHFFYGYGRNGKSVFANVLTYLLGDYVLTAPAEMLMRRDKGSATNDVARLVGVRLLMANETRNGQAFDDLTLKTLVSTERMSARFLYQEFFDFWPTHKILIRGNHKPLIADETDGAWRRIRLVPFDLRLAEDKVDPKLESKLRGEAEGILAWAVRGCLAWQKEGLTPSPRVNSASACYRAECDLIGEFLEDYTLDPQGQISQPTLWSEWRSWCQDNGVREGSKKTFTRKLEGRGIRAQGWKGDVRQYSGVRRKAVEECRATPAPLPQLTTGTTPCGGVSAFYP